MAFDWTKVNGYRDGMTAEEMVKLLEGFEFDPPKPEGSTVSKALFDTTASELANVKKELKARMSEDERKEAERLSAEKALKEELETLRRERAEATFKSRLLGAKYSETDAAEMAKAYSSGDMEAFLTAISKASENNAKTLRMEFMKETPRPGLENDTAKGDPSVDYAVNLAKTIAASDKAANDVLSRYI